jgi:hypothetical protein
MWPTFLMGQDGVLELLANIGKSLCRIRSKLQKSNRATMSSLPFILVALNMTSHKKWSLTVPELNILGSAGLNVFDRSSSIFVSIIVSLVLFMTIPIYYLTTV